ncbi:ubiquitin-like domain-containing protein [Cellulomonas sp. P24]|uniref:aggregation-promoting factor C-terminal-like domain-containing protein n=1 Tax=Cellulomonas sp. P24 TaxID=2885206 RepID=UPI002870885C|nr:ubiquitin-like domain-containing protein [Cellulomonas sp. P24]MCR6493738.1 ubiquitin-like domain-containing protein [Cellulomonas sp. P24]
MTSDPERPESRRARAAVTGPEGRGGVVGAVRGLVAGRRPGPRVVRLAAQGLVLALVAGGTSAFAVMHKSVTVDVDGHDVHVTAFGKTVQDVLKGSGITVGAGDAVTPALSATAINGGDIVVRHGREIEVVMDGEKRSVWTTALTVGEAVQDLGVRDGTALLSASRSEPLGRAPLRVSTEKTIHLVVDGQVIDGISSEPTVRGALKQIGLVLNEGDQVSVPLDATAVDGLVVLVTRAAQSGDTATEAVPFTEVEVPDPTLSKGTRRVKVAGRAGQKVVTYATKVVGGAVVSRTPIATKITVEPITQVIRVGTMAVPSLANVVVAPGSAQDIGRQLAAARGWGDSEFACLLTLWDHESGWRVNASNASSGAYGIPQALPGSKMASVGADWQTNPATQITWGLNYIAGRYGTPCGALGHWQSSGWY